MYHAQTPPPDHAVSKTTFGITWVDLVFPFFLLAMGAAIPIAFELQSQTKPNWQLFGGILGRGSLIAAFAIIIQHLRPDELAGQGSTGIHWLAIGLFFAVCLAFAKWPRNVPLWLGWSLKGLGWIAILVALALLPFRDSKGFDVGRSDIILMVLAHVYVTGTVIWWLTRNSPFARIATMGIMAALYLTRGESEFAMAIWNWTPAPWAYNFEFQKYLLIVLPGTIVGDLYIQYSDGTPIAAGHWSRAAGITILGIATQVGIVFTLFSREHSRALIVGIAASVGLLVLTWRAKSPTEKLMGALVSWGAAFLMIGLLVEPLGGGIRKDSPTTLSYFFVTAGLAFFLLSSLLVIFPKLPRWSPLRLFTEAGANPMLAYVAVTNLSVSVFVVSGIEAWVANQGFSPEQLTAYAGVKTLFVGIVAMLATRLKFFLRA